MSSVLATVRAVGANVCMCMCDRCPPPASSTRYARAANAGGHQSPYFAIVARDFTTNYLKKAAYFRPGMKKNSIRYSGQKSKARSLRTYPPRCARGLCHAGFETLTFAPCSVMYYFPTGNQF